MKISAVSLTCLLALAAAPLALADPGNADLRLQLERVSLDAETGKLDQAFALLDKLKTRYPDNPQVLAEEADLNLRIGNRGAAFAALAQARAVDPSNQDILDRERSALVTQGNFADGGYTFRRTREAFEQYARVDGQAQVAEGVTAGLNVENDHLHSREPIIRASGALANFHGDKQRGTLMLGKAFASGDQAQGDIYGNNNSVGAGAQYSLADHWGATTLSGDFQKPDWDYVEMVIGDGTKDDVHIERKQIITSHLQATLGGGYNRYSLQHDDNVAAAAAWDLNVAYTYPYSFTGKAGDAVTFGAYYTVDAEYFTHVDKRVSGGAIYEPLPTSSYEIHALNISASKNITSQLYGEAYGGYAIDRLGDNGPLFGASLTYSPIERLGIELRASRTMLGGVNNSEREDIVGLNLKWKW